MKSSTFLFVWVGFCFAAIAQPEVPTHLEYFGYAVVDCLWDDPNDEGDTTNYLDEVAAHSNIAQLCVFSAAQNVVPNIDAMNALCVQPLLAVQSVLFEVEDDNAPSGQNWKLADDYLANWETFKTINAAGLSPEQIAAFYLMDEPFWNGITAAEIETACNLVKGDFPDINTCFIEAYPVVDQVVIPATLDWIGFDRYGVADVTTDADYQADLATIKAARVSPDQRILLISDTQWLPIYPQVGLEIEDMAAVCERYIDLAVSDLDVVGVVGYLWPGGLDLEGHLGLRNLPQSVQSVNIDFGTAVKNANDNCIDNVYEAQSENPIEVQLAPNPSVGDFFISANLPVESIAITDAMGGRQNFTQNRVQGRLHIQTNLSAGLYFVRIAFGDDKRTACKKLRIE